MNQRGTLLLWAVCIAIILPCISTVAVETRANPYQSIIERNVFGLKPPVQPTAPAPEEVKPSKVQLIGIANMNGKKIALIKFIEPPKPGQPVPQEPLVLSEGEAAQDIEVIEIDEKAGLAKILNKGKPATLDIKDFMATLPGSSGAAPQLASGPPVTPRGSPMPSVQPQRQAVPPTSVPAPVGRPQPPSSGVTSVQPQTHQTPPTSVPAPMPIQTIPERPIRTPPPEALPYEQQIIMIELERERTRDLFLRGEYPPLPPTELTPEEDLKVILAPPPIPKDQP